MNRNLWKNITGFLFKQNDFMTLLFFLAVSFLLWLSMKSNRQTEQNQPFIIHYRLDDTIALPPSMDDTLQVRFKGRFRNWWTWTFKKKELYLDPAKPHALEEAHVKRLIEEKWKSPVEMGRNDIRLPQRWHWKKIPISLRLHLQAAPHYALRSVKITPDSVWVWAPLNVPLPDSIPTRLLERKHLKGTWRSEIALDVKPPLRSFPSKVGLQVTSSLYEEKDRQVPVRIPKEWKGKLLLMPASVHVHYKRWIHENAGNDQWILEADTSGINLKDQLPVRLVQKPAGVFQVEWYPHQVDYVIYLQSLQ